MPLWLLRNTHQVLALLKEPDPRLLPEDLRRGTSSNDVCTSGNGTNNPLSGADVPPSAADHPDHTMTALVIPGHPRHPYTKDGASIAELEKTDLEREVGTNNGTGVGGDETRTSRESYEGCGRSRSLRSLVEGMSGRREGVRGKDLRQKKKSAQVENGSANRANAWYVLIALLSSFQISAKTRERRYEEK